MEFLDARRLTGPSLLADGPGAILDIACTPAEADALVPVWEQQVSTMLSALDWPIPEFTHHKLSGGISLFFPMRLDALYAASEINEWAYAAIDAELNGADAPNFDATVETIRASAAEEANPELLALEAAANRKQTTFLWDDDEASLGLGRGATTWPVRTLPDASLVEWGGHTDVPIGLVTGTNGKTTTVRLATNILRAADKNVGLSSTDWIAVNDHILDRGDWSGPGGARAVLRQNNVDVAILESARGGLLRRGLGVNKADASLITNIAEDHLGDFGSQSLRELMDIKWIVSRAVREDGKLILNADDELLVDKSTSYSGRVVWFSLDVANPIVNAHCENGGEAYVLDDGHLVHRSGGDATLICKAAEIPITLGGAAKHNVANALAAAALTAALGTPVDTIAEGLRTMSQDDNPGRCNVYDVDGCKVLVDFAHNPHAMAALFDMAEALPAQRRVLCFGQAGDRPDRAIQELARDAWSIGLDHVIVSELEAYHRGREHGEVFGVIRDELVSRGAREDQIGHFDEETESLAAALDWAEPGDLIIMLALGGALPIQQALEARGATS
ncbi:MAG: Mur ligase family protein [Pseudomonadota bacterium]